MQSTIERFMDNVHRQSDGCWMWTAGHNDAGYGYFSTEGRTIRAHRWVYEQLVGTLPDGRDLDHTCHSADKQCPGGSACAR